MSFIIDRLSDNLNTNSHCVFLIYFSHYQINQIRIRAELDLLSFFLIIESFLLEDDSVTTTIVYPYPYRWERTLFLLIKLVAASGRAVTRVRKQDYLKVIKLTHTFRSLEVLNISYGAIDLFHISN